MFLSPNVKLLLQLASNGYIVDLCFLLLLYLLWLYEIFTVHFSLPHFPTWQICNLKKESFIKLIIITIILTIFFLQSHYYAGFAVLYLTHTLSTYLCLSLHLTVFIFRQYIVGSSIFISFFFF